MVGDGDSPDTRLLLLSERLGTEGALRAEPDSVPALTPFTRVPANKHISATSMIVVLLRILILASFDLLPSNGPLVASQNQHHSAGSVLTVHWCNSWQILICGYRGDRS